ncbi:TlpA family protein disulfide reductase [Ramlibacter rhizophilus]|uniref:TlpA family protein disulfide reductase n=1 Tax=Ramlibacter rhizophilus TaxID=1781167 RepID=UPI0014325E89|nr:hypothetical protein [Ramlibacter rhizophilus]
MAQTPVPSFKATVLTGEVVTEQKLLGQPTVLIVTPSRDAAQETRQWVQALRKNIQPGKVRVRDVLALDLPFFISEQDALSRARQKIPDRYHDQTWLMNEGPLEEAFSIPASSEDAFVLVLDSQGQVVARAKGQPTQANLQQIQDAVRKLTG